MTGPPELWSRHGELLAAQRPTGLPDISDELLELKRQLAVEVARECRLCARACGVNRPAGELGYCGVGWPGCVAQEHIHFGEVAQIIPTHSIFFAGCTMRCVYCRKMALASDAEHGTPWNPAELAATVERRRRQGARTLKLLGGTPEPQLPQVLELFAALETRMPVAWETTMYLSPEAVELLAGVVDYLICNVRYGNDDCAWRLSDAPGYVGVVREAFGRLGGWVSLGLRHLVLPGHADCCSGPVAGMLQKLAPEAELMLLLQYSPFGRAGEYRELAAPLSATEARRAVEIASRHKERVRVWETLSEGGQDAQGA